MPRTEAARPPPGPSASASLLAAVEAATGEIPSPAGNPPASPVSRPRVAADEPPPRVSSTGTPWLLVIGALLGLAAVLALVAIAAWWISAV